MEVVYKLIESFLHLPIYDEYGNLYDYCNIDGIPPVGDISRVLLDIALREVFEVEFLTRYPLVSYTRLMKDVFLLIQDSEKDLFNEKAGYELLESLDLSGEITSIGRGDDPIPSCLGMNLDLDASVLEGSTWSNLWKKNE